MTYKMFYTERNASLTFWRNRNIPKSTSSLTRNFMSSLGQNSAHFKVAEVVILCKFLWRSWERLARSHQMHFPRNLCPKSLLSNYKKVWNTASFFGSCGHIFNFDLDSLNFTLKGLHAGTTLDLKVFISVLFDSVFEENAPCNKVWNSSSQPSCLWREMSELNKDVLNHITRASLIN